MDSGHTLHALRSFKTGSLGSQTLMKTILHGTRSTRMLVVLNWPKGKDRLHFRKCIAALEAIS